MPKLAEISEFSDEELFDVSSALTLLGFAHLERGDIILTPLGKQYTHASNSKRKEIFGHQLLENIPLIAYIRQGLVQDPSGDLHKDLFLRLLRFTLNEVDALSALRVAIEWGRYGDLFEYDFNTGILTMPKNDEAAAE